MNFIYKNFVSNGWKDYELIDCGDANRLERWGKYTFIRPDPQALWEPFRSHLWKNADAIYHRSKQGGGSWEFKRRIPDEWLINYSDFTFKLRLTGFKHTGLFPEQAYNWERIYNSIKSAKGEPKVLNLFGYTGAATVAAAYAGANVCHVDSSKGMLSWCRENVAVSGIPDGRVRYIPEDCLKFVERELKRGNRYDAIIMDPPSFGRGAKGEVWKFEYNLMPLLKACKNVLSEEPLFFLINSYTSGVSPIVTANMLASVNLPMKNTEVGELLLPFGAQMHLPCGSSVWAE